MIIILFAGSELIEWIMDKLHVQSTIEAVHVGNLICHYGYIFPVQDTKMIVLKDDATMYRFQSPYFWPSQSSLDPDNTDYGKLYQVESRYPPFKPLAKITQLIWGRQRLKSAPEMVTSEFSCLPIGR